MRFIVLTGEIRRNGRNCNGQPPMDHRSWVEWVTWVKGSIGHMGRGSLDDERGNIGVPKVPKEGW